MVSHWTMARMISVGAVGQGADGVPLDEGADDLREPQGGDRQVVALQPQHGHTDQRREQRGHNTGYQQGGNHTDGELHPAAVIVLIDRGTLGHGDRQDRIAVSAHEHKARLAQGEKARKAVQQVHGDRDQRINRAFLQHGDDHGLGPRRLLDQAASHVKQRHHSQGNDEP